MADSTAAASGRVWDRSGDPTRAWTRLREQARTEAQRACIAAATAQADRVWVVVHDGRPAAGPAGPTSPTVPARNADWHRIALSAYELLHDSGAYAHLAGLRPRACAAAEPIIAAWLDSPDPLDHHDHRDGDDGWAGVTAAARLGVGDAVNVINCDTQVAHLSTVLGAAQDAAVFGIPGHRVDLVAAASHGAGTVVRVVVDTPTGLALASQPVRLGDLIGPDAAGVGAVIAALRRVAQVATGLFTTYADTVWRAPPPIPTLRTTSPAGRAFPQLRTDQRAAPPIPPAPLPGPDPTDRTPPDPRTGGRS